MPGQDYKQQQSMAWHKGWLRSKELCWVLCQILSSPITNLALAGQGCLHQPESEIQGWAEPGAEGLVCSNTPNPAVLAARMGCATSSSAHMGGGDPQAALGTDWGGLASVPR